MDEQQVRKRLAATKAEVRDYQVRLISKSLEHFGNGIKSVMINAPTGSGKTLLALATSRLLQQQHNVGVAWVAMRRNLLKQAAAENERLGIGLEHCQYISMFDKNPPSHDHAGRPIKILVADEAHHDPVGSMANIYNIIRPQYILGLTATVFRSDRVKLSFDKVIRDIGIHQLIQAGFLSTYHQYTIEDWTVDSVVETFLREPEHWGKTAIYWHKRESAIECCERLTTAGIKADTIFGSQPASEREAKLEAFDKGEIQVLVNMMLLTEGWDCPSLKTVFCRDSIKGPTMQICGRVFRKYPGIDQKQVVQSKLTHWPIHRTATPALASVWMQDEKEWRSYAQSEEIELVSRRACITLAHTQTKMPGYILKKQQEKQGRQFRRHRAPNMGGVDNTTESGLARRNDGDFSARDGWVGGFGGGAIIH